MNSSLHVTFRVRTCLGGQFRVYTHGLTYMLTTEHEVFCAAPLSPLQSSPMTRQSSVIMLCRGSRETRSSSNNTLRAAEGRGNEPSRSERRSCHPTTTLTQAIVAATMAQHRIHAGTTFFLSVRVRERSNEGIWGSSSEESSKSMRYRKTGSMSCEIRETVVRGRLEIDIELGGFWPEWEPIGGI